MPDTSPTPVDIDALQRRICCAFCSPHRDEHCWTCQETAHLIAELRSTRASIGPDSERIRELEAENAELRAEMNRLKCDHEWHTTNKHGTRIGHIGGDRGPDIHEVCNGR